MTTGLEKKANTDAVGLLNKLRTAYVMILCVLFMNAGMITYYAIINHTILGIYGLCLAAIITCTVIIVKQYMSIRMQLIQLMINTLMEL